MTVREEDELRPGAYQALLAYSTDLVAIIDATGIVRYASPSYGTTLGYRPAQLVGTDSFSRVHPDDRERVRTALAEALRLEGAPVTSQFRYRHADGTWRILEATGTNRLADPLVRGFVVNSRDITAQVRAHEMLEQQVAERTRELSTLLQVASQVASTLELRPLLGLLLDHLEAVIAHSGSSIYVVEGEWLHMVEHRFPPDNAPLSGWLRMPLTTSLFWPTVSRGEPFVIDDVHGDLPDAVAYRSLWGDRWESIRPYCRSYIAVPLILKDRTIGALIMSHAEPAYFTRHRQALALAMASQAAVAIENAQLYAQAREMAVLEERQRLSRELHDSVSQALYSIALGARTARALLDTEPARAAAPLDFVLSQAEVGLAEMRSLILELRPEALENAGLIAMLRKEAETMQQRHHLTVETDLCDEPAIPANAKEAIYRIAQEALHNVVKHAGAGAVRVSLTTAAHELVLRIQDNGRGFDATRAYPGHLGLHSMHERMAGIGGTLQVESAVGRGTRVCAAIPYPGSRT